MEACRGEDVVAVVSWQPLSSTHMELRYGERLSFENEEDGREISVSLVMGMAGMIWL